MVFLIGSSYFVKLLDSTADHHSLVCHRMYIAAIVVYGMLYGAHRVWLLKHKLCVLFHLSAG